jgi:hypothetical protein
MIMRTTTKLWFNVYYNKEPFVTLYGKGCLRSCGMLFLSSICYCVGEFVKGTKTQTFAHPKEPQAQEAGIAVCSPPSICVTIYIK